MHNSRRVKQPKLLVIEYLFLLTIAKLVVLISGLDNLKQWDNGTLIERNLFVEEAVNVGDGRAWLDLVGFIGNKTGLAF